MRKPIIFIKIKITIETHQTSNLNGIVELYQELVLRAYRIIRSRSSNTENEFISQKPDKSVHGAIKSVVISLTLPVCGAAIKYGFLQDNCGIRAYR